MFISQFVFVFSAYFFLKNTVLIIKNIKILNKIDVKMLVMKDKRSSHCKSPHAISSMHILHCFKRRNTPLLLVQC